MIITLGFIIRSSSSSSSGSSSGDEVASQQSRRAHEGSRGVDFGCSHMTKVWNGKDEHVGWEMQCKHPLHQTPRSCRKNLRLTGVGRTAELTLTMLQALVSWGAKVADQAAHNKLWVKIEVAVKSGTLYAGMEIDPPTKFLGENSLLMAVEPLARKRRRTEE